MSLSLKIKYKNPVKNKKTQTKNVFLSLEISSHFLSRVATATTTATTRPARVSGGFYWSFLDKERVLKSPSYPPVFQVNYHSCHRFRHRPHPSLYALPLIQNTEVLRISCTLYYLIVWFFTPLKTEFIYGFAIASLTSY